MQLAFQKIPLRAQIAGVAVTVVLVTLVLISIPVSSSIRQQIADSSRERLVAAAYGVSVTFPAESLDVIERKQDRITAASVMTSAALRTFWNPQTGSSGSPTDGIALVRRDSKDYRVLMHSSWDAAKPPKFEWWSLPTAIEDSIFNIRAGEPHVYWFVHQGSLMAIAPVYRSVTIPDGLVVARRDKTAAYEEQWLALAKLAWFPMVALFVSITMAIWLSGHITRPIVKTLESRARIEAVGRLASNVAHDFNNILTVIHTTSELLLEDMEPTEAQHEDVLEIRNAAERGGALTKRLLSFSKQQIVQPRLTTFDEIVLSVETMLRRLMPADVKLVVNRDDLDNMIWADPSQLDQIVMNLVINARDSMPEGGTLTVQTSHTVVNFPNSVKHVTGYLPLGTFSTLSVNDSGCGIETDILSHIFEPFFSTKPSGKGTGLGLAIVHSIVQENRGYIAVASRPGKGTTFTVYFPMATEPDGPVRTPAYASLQRSVAAYRVPLARPHQMGRP